MSSDTPSEAESPPAAFDIAPESDEERLAKLEKANRLNRLLIFALALLLFIVLSSLATSAVVKMLADAPPPFDPEAFAALQHRAEELETELAALKQEQARQDALLKLVATPASAPPAPAAATPAAAPSQDIAALKLMGRTLLGQEQSFQQSLQALKNGMRDLADMIPGSRSWLDDYNEELDKAVNASVQRSKAVQQWGSKLPHE
ncbi:hypothetical protein SAMN05216588_112114 [Pseudomonas flavescens]|uniref:Uncharacterized protein n=1 Tax=Phytopseudomonas flavescens TaxID=29435 RepID=A0A1G8II92_9GAMM|nr:hypothetical protein [Pseudomonas flavescens]SDI18481.1 hypothetical protein SAMN05216588_112114 [Pseudomonas flavescens]